VHICRGRICKVRVFYTFHRRLEISSFTYNETQHVYKLLYSKAFMDRSSPELFTKPKGLGGRRKPLCVVGGRPLVGWLAMTPRQYGTQQIVTGLLNIITPLIYWTSWRPIPVSILLVLNKSSASTQCWPLHILRKIEAWNKNPNWMCELRSRESHTT
jgi:hypothetical protein